MKKIVVYAACVLFLALLCRHTAACADAVRAALKLCLFSALPSLFPFFAAGSLAVSTGLAGACGRLLAPLMRTCFHLPGCGAAALALGFLGGYPAGARMAADLWHAGLCTREEASCLAACCNNTGPAFLIGLCGGGLFHSLRAGVFLYLVHIAAALLTAFVLRPKSRPPAAAAPASEELPLFHCLTRSVLSAGRSCLMIGAFLLFFSVVLCLLRQTGVLPAAAATLTPLLAPLGLSSRGVTAVLTGCVELTQGLAALSAEAGCLSARLTAVSFVCAFGSLSVLFQTAAAAEGLSFRRCVCGKCVHACFAALLCALTLLLLPGARFV